MELARLSAFLELSARTVPDIPDASRVVVLECGHIPHLEGPEQFLTEFLSFLARLRTVNIRLG